MAAFSLGFALVSGRSMEPTLYDGDRLLVGYGAPARPGRLAVLRLPGRPVAVKRLVTWTPDGWWVARDNPDLGVDSRQVGAIADADVLGIVICRVWPLRRATRRAGRPGSTADPAG